MKSKPKEKKQIHRENMGGYVSFQVNNLLW